MLVSQHSTPGRSVDIAIGELVLSYLDYAQYVWIDSIYNLATTTNTSGNPRIDAIIAYVDLSVVSSASNNNPGALKLMAVAGTPAGSPVAPDDTAVQAAVGAGNPFYRLANVTLANSYTQVLNANIADKRSQFVIGSNPKIGFFIADTPSVANDLSWNPICVQAQTFQGIYAYARTAPTGASLSVRIYNVTQSHDVGTITLSAGSNTASTTSLTNSGVNVGDILRCDCTGVGSTIPGSNISVVLY